MNELKRLEAQRDDEIEIDLGEIFHLLLNQKIELTSKRTTKEKLMAYLLMQAKQNKSRIFAIPYDRQELADYLGVERSAMSAELSKLRREGRIDYHKNQFKILE